MLTLDYDLKASDIQQLASADSVVGLFTALGYGTDRRIVQTPSALGFPDSLAREVVHMERIADQEDGALQVYLVEMKRVTVALTQSLAKAFKGRDGFGGQFLLVLTTRDYQRLDFVLLEQLPASDIYIGSPRDTRTILRPRILSVDRHNPDRVSLRVLRRFSYTEVDADYQWDKLRSAYGVAEWSEPLFNNRALFSDYYLNERLPMRAEWKEDPRLVYRMLNDLLADARQRFARQPEGRLRAALFEPIFKILGWEAKANKASNNSLVKADYDLVAPSGGKVPCLTYVWDRTLDGPDGKNIDIETPTENPAQTVVSILEEMKSEAIGWAIVTNGKVWRLYSAMAHSRATNYYEIDLEETLASPDVNEAFRFFWLLFRAQAFDTKSSFVDSLLIESATYAKALGERLKDNVFENVFPLLAEGFIKNWGKPATDLTEEDLRDTFHATLTFLYRLLFLLYAEARDLLPVKEARGYWEISLKCVKDEIAKKGGVIADLAPNKLKEAYSGSSMELYDRLNRLFQVIDRGDSNLNVPVYNGGLFITLDQNEPLGADETEAEELRMARFLTIHKIPDRFLAQGLDLLARDIDEKTQALAVIDYKSLGVRQLGSIYEGLLEFKLRIAHEKMAVVAGKKGDQIVPYVEAKEKGVKLRMSGRGAARTEFVYPKGAVYLENDLHERKASGSYYTPDYIVKYIVQHTLGPALDAKTESLRPKLREAQKAYQAAVQRRKDFQKIGQKGDDPEKTAFTFHGLVDELFDLRVLDPAMGSGHFLVEAVDFITDRLLAYLNAFPWNPVTAALRQTRQTILEEMQHQGISVDPARLTDVNLLKRHVLKRCIFGVDLNPMAVELAKVSLWLDCFTLGAPLSFLDHHLKCGNSLIGAQVTPVREEIEMVTTTRTKKVVENPQAYKTKQVVSQQFQMFGSMWAGAMLATDLMRQVGELADTTAEQVHQSRVEYKRAVDALMPFKRILNVYTSRWFGNPDSKLSQPTLQFLRNEQNVPWLKDPKQNLPAPLPGYREIADNATKVAREKRFFHWELEFPEVFFGPSKGSAHEIVMKDNPGFDAVIGNPPWVDVQDISEKIKNYLRFSFTSAVGKCDLYALFVERGISLLKMGGSFSMIIQSKFLVTEYGLGLRSSLAENADLKLLVHFADAPLFGAIAAYPLILVAQKKTNDKKDPVVVIQFPSKISPLDVEQIIASENRLKSFTSKVDDVKFRTSKAWQIDLPNFLSKEDRFKNFCIPFGEIGTISYGVKTNGDDYYLADRKTWQNRGVEEKLLRPAIKPRDFDRYVIFDEHTVILFPYEDEENGLKLIDLDNYPGAKKYLESHKDALSERRFYGKSILEHGMKYYELPYVSSYSRESKLAFPTIAKRANFALDPSGDILFIAPCYVVHVNSDFDKAFLLSILNSKFMDLIIRARSTDLASGYMEMQRQYVEAVPIRRITFNTTLARRNMRSGEAQVHIANGDATALLKLVTTCLDAQPEESDVVHDLLAFLARRMLELSKKRQAEMKRFLTWLEGLLNVNLNDLTNKTRLKNYPGDYQKSESELSYAELEDILYKNKGKLGVSLSDSRLQDRLRAEYETSLKVLRPVNTALTWTDQVIDQIVFKLYGLTEPEIAIVEGRAALDQDVELVEILPSTSTRPQTIARVSDPNELARILQALDLLGPLTTRQLADEMSNQRITLEPRKADTIRHEFIFLGWIEADQARWSLTERGKDLAAIGGDASVGEFARQLCLDSDRHNQQVVSRLLVRMEQLSPDLQGAIILPRPEMKGLHASLDDVRKLLRAGLPRWSGDLQQLVKNFAGLPDSNAIADQIIKDIHAHWPKAKDSERTNRLQERISEAFVEVMFGQIMAANDVEIWQERMDWAGLTHTAREIPGVQGEIWFPVGAFREKADNFTPLEGLVNHPGDSNALTYFRYTPTGAEFEKQFMQILYEGYRQVQNVQQGNEYVSLLTVRDWVCYRLRISNEVFENTLQSQFPRALRGEIPYSLALEVDVMPSQLMRLGNARPVRIDKQSRYIIAMRSRTG